MAAGAAAGDAVRFESSASLASTPASRSADFNAGTFLSLTSSKLKFEMSCGFPSSRISKSAALSPRTTAPDLSRTMTSTETTFGREPKTDQGRFRCCANGDVWKPWPPPR